MTRLSRIASRARVFALAASIFAWVALAPTSPARADTVVLTTVPFTWPGTNPCTAEAFIGTGGLHLLLSSNSSASGMVQSHLEANLQGLQAVTLSGKKYVVVDTQTWVFDFDSLDVAPFHETLEWIAQFIRQGEDGTLLGGDDFYEHFLAHATVNANGIVTVDDFSDDCRCQ